MTNELTQPFTYHRGVVAANRIMMAPMVAQASDEQTRKVHADDLAFYGLRSGAAGTIVSGAMNVTDRGWGFDRGLSIDSDDCLPGLTELATAMKKDGAAAVAQLYHGGREAHNAAARFGWTQGPSTMQFPWLDTETKEMSDEQIHEVIAAFRAATRRAIDAGFDGVEVHGANHYLLQQFFSAYSNRRDDEWGGDLERRMAFPLACLDASLAEAETAGRPFLVGYRISPDEVHGDNAGYTIVESLELIDAIAAREVDYLSVSLWTGYDAIPPGKDRSYGELIRERVAGRCPVAIVSGIHDQASAEDALQHGDLVAVGRAALIDPQFATKIAQGRGDEIRQDVEGLDLTKDLALTPELINWFRPEVGLLPPIKGLAFD